MAEDLLRPGLSLVFCGYNPSLAAGHTYHYAHPTNRFWRVLFAAGITERLYAPEEDAKLLDLGVGFTNLVARPTRSAAELTREEAREGAAALRGKLEYFEPRAVAYTGIGVYRLFRATSKAGWGMRETPTVAGVTDIVVPSPSGLNRMGFEELTDHYGILLPFLS